ncbi:MAG: hypothetical protein VYB15_06125 [Planctomycetota bacterium]|nr:hypothetical protein [Planctomycetota bacterium]MEE3296603.1 hypothetical protein [Planctomycetota bacterium]
MARKKTAKIAEKPDSSNLIAAFEEKGPAELDSFLLEGANDRIKEVVLGCYCSELVSLLLDAKKASVRAFFLRAISTCKRAVTPIVSLYSYRVYLSNPLPLSLKGSDGEIHANYFALLGVNLNATDDEVAEAYKLLTKAHSPAAFSPRHRSMGEERLEEIKMSHKMLKTPEARQEARAILSSHPDYCFPRRDSHWAETAAAMLG